MLSLLGPHYSDPDGSTNTKPGIAVFQTSGNGTWQYSTNGTTWTAIGNVSQIQALLLPEGDSVRFMPAANWSGQANLYFVAWDGSQGKAGGIANVIAKGGTTPFSVDAGGLAVTVNPVPIWVGTGAALTPVLPDSNQTPAGDTIAAVFGSYFQDNNLAVSVGVAIVSVTGASTGAWQFLTSGGAWTNFPTVSATAALLLSANDEIRFVPKSTFVGAVSLKALAWDGSIGDAGHARQQRLQHHDLDGHRVGQPRPDVGQRDDHCTSVGRPVRHQRGHHGQQPLDASKRVRRSRRQGVAARHRDHRRGCERRDGSVHAFRRELAAVAERLAVGGAVAAEQRVAAVHGGQPDRRGHADLRRLGPDARSRRTDVRHHEQRRGNRVQRQPEHVVDHGYAIQQSGADLEPAAVGPRTGRRGERDRPAITVSTLLKQAGDVDLDGATVAARHRDHRCGRGGRDRGIHAAGQKLAAVAERVIFVGLVVAEQRLAASGGRQPDRHGDARTSTAGTRRKARPAKSSTSSTAAAPAAFSATSATASIPIGEAPSWSAATGAALTDLPPGVYSTTSNSSPPGNTIATVFGSFFLDATANLPVGVAVSGVSGNGTWQYSLTSGASWVTFTPTLSKSSAFLLSAGDLIRFVPRTTGAQIGTLTAYAWDGSVYSPGTAVNLTQLGTGGATPFSATTLVASSAFNTAPTLTPPTPPISLTPVKENANSAVVTAASLLSNAGYVDPDGKSVLSGIAVTADTGPGVWQWLNGATWTALPSLPANSAFLLPSATQLRFQPANNLATNTNGSATLTYLAWDETAGSADATYALTGQGAASAFSTASATASMPVNFVKQAPTWLSGSSAAFTPVLGFPTRTRRQPRGRYRRRRLRQRLPRCGGHVRRRGHHGANRHNGRHLAIPHQRQLRPGQSFPTTLSTSAALVLSANDLIRFVPSKSFSGAVSLTAYAWDGTGNFTNNIANLKTTGFGGSTPFSATTLVADCLVNSAPTLMP